MDRKIRGNTVRRRLNAAILSLLGGYCSVGLLVWLGALAGAGDAMPKNFVAIFGFMPLFAAGLSFLLPPLGRDRTKKKGVSDTT